MDSTSSTSPSPPVDPGPEPAPSPEPDPTSGGESVCEGPPPAPGYECVQNCGPPVAGANDPPPGWSWLSPEQARNREQFGCPICLPGDAQIETPNGQVAISTLTPGAAIWSVDEEGRRVVARVLHVMSVPAPAHHEIARVELADGRIVRASPGHPDATGRALGSVAVGDELDQSTVTDVRRIPYVGRTYDLVLSDGRTQYLADGVRLRTSLGRYWEHPAARAQPALGPWTTPTRR